MNIHTLSKEKLDYKNGALPVALYPERMIKKDSEKRCYYGRILNRGKFDIETIAEDLVVFGSKRTKEQIIKDWNETCAAIIDRLINGASVEAEYFNFSLQVKGLFEYSQDIYKKGRNSIELQVRPTKKLKEMLDNLTCKVFLGKTITASIKNVYDGVSKCENKYITRGGFLKIKGENIRLFGNDERVGLYLVSESNEMDFIKLSQSQIINSLPSELHCIVPDDLNENQRYKIKIITQYMRTSKERKEPLVCESDFLLEVR
ncbi:DUF4469 domain-containing protein [Treponema sp. C6A8]|uniref:DUF4469 domain-containing protein n=1 Tax=Treponema sp. C6A8 TaxID=1410609 RepID=UPI000482C7B0|nr:DUF4469 domain-containing protein [Treponema sp. C6A8]